MPAVQTTGASHTLCTVIFIKFQPNQVDPVKQPVKSTGRRTPAPPSGYRFGHNLDVCRGIGTVRFSSSKEISLRVFLNVFYTPFILLLFVYETKKWRASMKLKERRFHGCAGRLPGRLFLISEDCRPTYPGLTRFFFTPIGNITDRDARRASSVVAIQPHIKHSVF
jgi:hypothetical protein